MDFPPMYMWFKVCSFALYSQFRWRDILYLNIGFWKYISILFDIKMISIAISPITTYWTFSDIRSTSPFIITIIGTTLVGGMTIIVQQFSWKLCNNCAFCDKSTKFGTEVENHITIISGYWGTTDLTFAAIFMNKIFHFCIYLPYALFKLLNVGITAKILLKGTT